MRNGHKIKFSTHVNELAESFVDWRSGPVEIMRAVDKELKQYGLEVVIHETDGDQYGFSILPIEAV